MSHWIEYLGAIGGHTVDFLANFPMENENLHFDLKYVPPFEPSLTLRYWLQRI